MTNIGWVHPQANGRFAKVAYISGECIWWLYDFPTVEEAINAKESYRDPSGQIITGHDGIWARDRVWTRNMNMACPAYRTLL